MHFLFLTVLLALASALPTLNSNALFPHEILDTRASSASIPTHITWHASTGSGSGNPSNGSMIDGSNTTASPIGDAGGVSTCGPFTYDDTSVHRTTVIRDDCRDLLMQLGSAQGYWEMWHWGSTGGQFKTLASNGTCALAIQRLGGGREDKIDGATGRRGELAIIGNQDAFRFLNASVHDFADGADEPYMDQERTQGHACCEWSPSISATMEFKIQLAEGQ